MNAVIVNLVVSLITLVGYSYLFVRQFFVARSKRDSVTPLRVIILLVFALTLVTLLPGIAFQVSRANGMGDPVLRNVATVTSSVNRVTTLILIIAFVNYRIKEEQ